MQAGSGHPVLLLHGFPQTHAAWHRVAPRLARHFIVIAADLPGYGESRGHANYSKREVGRALLRFMRGLGFERFAVIGHDRGARVAYRMALDNPEAITHLGVLDGSAVCEDYRAAASVDLEHERADRAAGRRIECPVLALWSASDIAGRYFEPLTVWRRWATQVSSRALDCGHFLMEEAPEAVASAIESLLARASAFNSSSAARAAGARRL